MTIPEAALKAADNAIADAVGHTSSISTVMLASAALNAALPYLGVKVRGLELEWDKHADIDEWYSVDRGDWGISEYVVSKNPVGSDYRMYVRGHLLEDEFQSVDAAKSAAQADFEHRILSQIEVADGGRAEVLEEAARWHDAEAERKRAVAVKSRRLEHQIATHEVSAAHFRALANAPAPNHADAGKSVEGDGWLPIESAPKDGTDILCASFSAAKGHEKRIGHMEVDRYRKEFGGFGKFNRSYWPATHWRPLPSAPQVRA